MADTVNPCITTEEELFIRLMQELSLVQGDMLLRKNAELKNDVNSELSALSYERCVNVIKAEFSRIKRTAIKRFAKVLSLTACVVLAVSAALILAVPTLHDAVFGKPEDTSPAVLPNENISGPTFRSCLPPTISPPPDKEEEDPGSEKNIIMSKKYTVSFDGEELRKQFLEELRQEQIEEMQQYRATHKNNLIVNGRIYNGYDINTSPKVSDPPQSRSGIQPAIKINPDIRPLVPGADYNGNIGPKSPFG